MRALVVVLLLAGCEEEEAIAPPPPKPAAKSYATRAEVAAIAKQRQECRDACEQEAIVATADGTQLRGCRGRCDRQFAPPPVEPPRSITVAPPHATPPAVRPR